MKRLGLWLLGGVSAFILSFAVIGAVLPGRVADIAHAPASLEVHLIGGLIHYDLLLPLDDETRLRLGWLADAGVAIDHPQAEWLVVGWGAHGFYTTTGAYNDVELGAVWRGLTGDSAVMRVDLAGDIGGIDSLPLPLSAPQYEALLAAIESSFASGPATRPLPIAGFSEFDQFFPAKGRFNLLNTCNVWIGRTLRAAGVHFGSWTPLPATVSLSHWLYQSG